MDGSPRRITEEPPEGSVIFVLSHYRSGASRGTGMLLRRRSGWTDMASSALARTWDDLTRIAVDAPTSTDSPSQVVQGCRVTDDVVVRIEAYLVARSLQDPPRPSRDLPMHTMPDQRSTTDQLRDLVVLANRNGLYDAADAITRRLLDPTR